MTEDDQQNWPHQAVMVNEVCEHLISDHQGCYLDGTAGCGGHLEAVLSRLAPEAQILGVDRDQAALAICQKRLSGDQRLRLEHATFDQIQPSFPGPYDGLLLDIGISSLQLDDPDRGFSFRFEGPLDMRMDQSQGEDLLSFLKSCPEKDLADILWRYGEERQSRRIAKRLKEDLAAGMINSSLELADSIRRVFPRRGRIDSATRSFQALRIALNDELGMLERFLKQAPQLLKSGGTLVIISFHSLEDRMVKQAFKHYHQQAWGDIVTKKPLRPSDDECEHNPRSRSARLRVFRKS